MPSLELETSATSAQPSSHIQRTISVRASTSIQRIQSMKKLNGALVGSGSSTQEALLGLASGAAFGIINPVVGHPFDLIKTQLQVGTAHRNSTLLQAVKHIYRHEGPRGFYKGFIPPLVSVAMTRGVQFSAYAGTYASCNRYPALSEEIPLTGGLKVNVLLGAIAAGSARAVLETPLEFIKVRAMVNKSALPEAALAMSDAAGLASTSSARFLTSAARSFTTAPISTVRHMYHGFVPTLLRSIGLLGSFFVMVDYSVRYIPDVVNAPIYGAFFKGGICGTLAWTLAFPIESAKSVIQADTSGVYKYMRGATWVVMKQLYQERGLVRGLYRGFVPGAGRSFLANGASMMVYAWFQDLIRERF